jgi:SAM-dependent methyltransferase
MASDPIPTDSTTLGTNAACDSHHADSACRSHTDHAAAKERVRRYYLASTQDYLKYYATSKHQHMHYGFDRDLPKGGSPTGNLVRYLGEVARIRAGERVLDAGCGVGGSLFALAAARGIVGVGLNLVEMQCGLARGFARERGLQEQVRFVCGDFMRPPFAPESFDVVWAVESSDHAPDKREWVLQMARLLRPGGRLIVADGFRAEGAFDVRQEAAYDLFLKGWAVPHLARGSEFASAFREAGLSVVREDITADVMPHATAIWRFGLIFVPLRKLLLRLGLTSREKLGNAEATLHQHSTLKEGLWTYEIFCGTKN